jgi:hypothetical protein
MPLGQVCSLVIPLCYRDPAKARSQHGSHKWEADRMKDTYPPRLSVAELHQEMNAYLDARRRASKAPATVETDKTKILGFLRWLETGEINE